MTKPTIHLNGTNGEGLFQQYLAAAIAVTAAIDTIQKVDFNARDYYLQGSGVFSTAVDEHHSRLERLEAVRRELDEIAADIADQNYQRERQRAGK